MNVLTNIDLTLLDFIHNNCQNYIFDKIMPFITSLGELGMVWIATSVLLLLTKKYKTIGFMTLCAMFLGALLGEGILKHLIQRPRPFMEIPTLQLLISKPTTFSFPSGHTTASFAAATILSSKIKKCQIPVFLLAILISFSRMYLFVHYPSDIFAGIILGIACAEIVLYIFTKKSLTP